MDAPIYDLSEPLPLLWFRHEGERHDLLRPDDLSLNQRRRIGRLWERIVALGEQPEVTDAEDLEHREAYRAIVQTLVPSLSAEVVEAIGQEKREAIVTAFFTNRPAVKIINALAERLTVRLPVPTGDASSPGSSASTGSPTPEAG